MAIRRNMWAFIAPRFGTLRRAFRLTAVSAHPPNRRPTLRDLHAFGIVSVFRRPSLLRIWEPLREHPEGGENFG